MNGFLPRKLVTQTLPLRFNPPLAPRPVYGIIYAPDGDKLKVASGVLAHLTVDGAKNTLTTRTDDNGSYSFDLANFFDSDYQPFYLPEEGGTLKLQFLDGKLGQTYLEVDSAVVSPVPPVTLSKLRKQEFNNDFGKVLGATSRLIAKIADEDMPVNKPTVTPKAKAPSPIKEEIQNVQQHIVTPNIQSPPPSSPPPQSAPAPTSAPAVPPPSQPRPDQGVDNTPPPVSPPAPVSCNRRVLMTQCNSCGTGAELIQTESCGETWTSMGSLAACRTSALCPVPTPAAVEPSPTPVKPTTVPLPTDVPDVPVVPTTVPFIPTTVPGSLCWNGNFAPDGDLANCPPRPTAYVSPPAGDTPTMAMTPKPTSSRIREALPPEEKEGEEAGSKTCAGGFVEGQSWQSECRDTKRTKYLCSAGSITSLIMFDPSCPGYYQQHIVPQDANLETVCSSNQRSVVSKKNPMLEIEECLAGTTCIDGECTVNRPLPQPTQSFNEALVSFFLPKPTEPILPKPTEVIQSPTERKIDKECSFSSDCPTNQTCVGFKCVLAELRPTPVPGSPTPTPMTPQCPGGYVSGQSWQLNCRGTKREVATCSDGKILTSLAPDGSCSGIAEEIDIPLIAPTISPTAGGGLTSDCEEETSPLLCGGSTKQLQCWFTARDQRGKCAAGLFCSGKCQETRHQPDQGVKSDEQSVPSPTPVKECNVGQIKCENEKTWRCVDGEWTPSADSVICSKSGEGPILHDYCDRGVSYCVDSTKIAVCKSDRSGYNRKDCAPGTACDDDKNRCAAPPTESGEPINTRRKEGSLCGVSEECDYGLTCFSNRCKLPRYGVAVVDNISRERRCVMSEGGKYETLGECQSGLYHLKNCTNQIREQYNVDCPYQWDFDAESQTCVEVPWPRGGPFAGKDQCEYFAVSKQWTIDRDKKICVRVQNLASGNFLTKEICERALKESFPTPTLTPTPIPTPTPKEVLIKKDEISGQEFDELLGKPCNWGETDVVFEGRVENKKCRVYCSTDNMIKKDYCDPFYPQIHLSWEEYSKAVEDEVGKECDGNRPITVFSGNVGEGGRFCTMSCLWHQSSGKYKIQQACFTQNLSQEKFCQQDQVVKKNSSGEVEILESCGFSSNCENLPPTEMEGRVCSQASRCREGQCVEERLAGCQNPGEIKPSEREGRYLQCDSNTFIWKPLADGNTIGFKNSCPNSYRVGYLESIAVVQDYIFPQGGITIECGGSLEGGGLSGNENPQTPITLFCDPTKPSFKTDCAASLTHELAHTYEARIDNEPGSNIFFNEDFNKEIGCRETYKEGEGTGIYRYGYEIAVNDNIYGPFIGWKDGTGQSRLNCSEAFALANNHYVYNACYQKKNFPIQYNWLKENIYNGNEFCDEN